MQAGFGIAVKCAVYCQGQVLLLQKADAERAEDACESSWDLPGGRVAYGESVEAAVRREIWEETGLQLNGVSLKATETVIRPDGLHLLILLHRGVCADNRVTLSTEHRAALWEDAAAVEKDDSIPLWIRVAVSQTRQSEALG